MLFFFATLLFSVHALNIAFTIIGVLIINILLENKLTDYLKFFVNNMILKMFQFPGSYY